MKIRQFRIALVALLLCLVSTDSVFGGRWAKDSYSISTDDREGDYYGIIVGNGGIGILPSREIGKTKRLVLNHVFDAAGFNGLNVAVEGINPFNLEFALDGKPVALETTEDWNQTVDLRHGAHITEFKVPGKASFKITLRALRGMPYCGLESVEINPLADVALEVKAVPVAPEKTYTDTACYVRRFKIVDKRIPVHRVSGFTKNSREKVSASYAFVDLPADASLQQGDGGTVAVNIPLCKGKDVRFDLLGSVCSTADFGDPVNESDRQITYGACEGVTKLITDHEKGWDELWQGDIIINGDDEAQQAIRMSLYNLYSSCRKGSRLSIPPFGLSSVGYSGHIFWDTELWMYPPMLFLNPGIAESMMDYRIDRLDAACRKARAYGFDGAMYPWESDRSGEEACPTWALTGAFEHHISADIAIAVWNYYCMNRDLRWLREKGYPLLENIADFWVSRSDRNADGSYSIRNVVCADEYAQGVDDNAFTNAAVSVALRNATKAARLLGYEPSQEWTTVADGLRIPLMADGVTAEYEGYDGAKIKQADTNLLAYPLGYITDRDRIIKDMEYYAPRINEKGPAMSFAVLAVCYSRLGMADKAYEMFRRSFLPNQLPPFGAVSEGAGGTNPYFATGAGGFLQAVINGFCGLELTDDGIVQQHSVLPRHWKSVTVTGVGPDKKTYTRRNSGK